MTALRPIHYSRTVLTAAQDERAQTSAPLGRVVESGMFARTMAQSPGREPLAATGARQAPWVDAIAEQWAVRLQAGTRWPMHFVFYLARRGRLQVSAVYEQHAWHLSVQAERPCTRQWLNDVRPRCEQRLAHQLGQAVHVLVSPGYSG